jgi:glycosyltransferase 2 family protein
MPEPAPTVPPAGSPPPAPPRTGTARRIVAASLRALESRAFKAGFVLLAAALGAYAVISQWSTFKTGLDDLGAWVLVQALLSLLVAWFFNMMVWRVLLSASGSRPPLAGASRVFFVGQLGKYVPGSVWPVLAQMELGRAYKVPRQRSATVAVLTMVVSLAVALLVTLATLPFIGGGATTGYSWAFLFVPVLLVCLHPRLLNPGITRLLRLARRPAPERPLSGAAIAAAMGMGLAAWILSGVHIWLLAVRLGAPSGHTLPLSIGMFAFAWSVGFLIVFAPAGAGVREVILVATLTPVLHSAGLATVVALVSRLLTVLADLIAAGLAAWLGRLRTPLAPAAPGPDPGGDAPDAADAPAGDAGARAAGRAR